MSAVRAGASQRSVARQWDVSLHTVQRWLARAAGERLDRVDWSSRPTVPGRIRRIDADLEDTILDIRRELKDSSPLGEYGAAAVRRELIARQARGELGDVPSLRTIGRTFERRGVLDARRRVRRPAPPPGWYLPDLARRRVELDSFDVVEGLRLRGGPDLEVLTGISLHGALTGAWPEPGVTTRTAIVALEQHWREHGLPAYVQFDNDTRFADSHGYTDLFGRLVRFCLSLAVVPVFAPPRETGFQAAIESFNGRWQAKVWTRFWMDSLEDVRARSQTFITASHARAAVRIESAPPRAAFPEDWTFDPRRAPSGRLVFLRRTTDQGRAEILGRAYDVDRRWVNRLVRGELDLIAGRLRFHALRRREPADQPLLAEHPYQPVLSRIWR